MKWFNAMKVSSKLLLGFALVLVIFLSVIGVNLGSLGNLVQAN